MSHCETAASIKGIRRGPLQDKPRKGTKIRALYDRLQASKGLPITFSATRGRYMMIDQLRDAYGLDLRNVGYGQWMLAGEWFGKVYVDYVAERMERAQ